MRQEQINELARNAIRANDREAANQLFAFLFQVIRRRCGAVTGDLDADDLAQSACMRIWAKREQYDQSRPFLVWALVVARSAICTEMRKASQFDAYEIFETSYKDAEPIPDTSFVWELFGPLSERERADVSQILAGRSASTLAKQTGRDSTTVRRHVRSALAKVRAEYIRQNGLPCGNQ